MNDFTLNGNVLTVQVPGCTKEHVKITYYGSLLTVETTPPPDSGQEPKKVTIFRPHLDPAGTTASVSNGVLTVTMTGNSPPPVTIKVN